ncbi:hypothetical protein ES319_A12G114900v1 [Gossypium barbadense]|uniref:UDP-glycosyltransferases domain-containing protein n=1 Tax=Gossypium barbadense TaxID=3634 RepID=A0A2P5WQY7_GOSBA|nr:hypothetical protein ES319_A12G114900v1 [Gossypium barbadense]PPR93520.1 hypothetical protein GOBAR_AA27146 [Gossypium barbadense]
MATTHLHIVMVPWSAFGYLIPFFQLALQLAKAGIKVSFISTPGNIKRLSNVPSNIATLLDLVVFPLPNVDDEQQLPEGCEATVDIPFEKIQYLKIAYDLLRQPVKQFVIDQKPDWILIDVIPHWMMEIAQEQHIPLASKAVAFRTCPEYEAEYLNAFEKITISGSKPVFPIGLLLPEKPQGRQTDEIFRWLNVQKPNSVVFVGFGSECKLSKEQTHEIAYGVELSGLPFLWALRKPHWAFNELDALPCGFQERTRGRGMVCFGWAPQLEILGHSSIGGSLFHAGWGSIIETLEFGHSLVVLPFVIDQPLNARLLVDKGLGVEIERSEDGSFSRDDIAKALRLAMVSAEGEKLRIRTREAAQVFGNRDLHDSYFNRFVEYLKENGAAN